MNLQNQIENYWSRGAERYSEGIQEELNSFKKDAWSQLIMEYAPRKEKLKVLDIGTGPGFFFFFLSLEGQDVTAVDCTEEMLFYAKSNAVREGVSPQFLRMDCHKFDFKNDSFDLLLCRNLTWTLQEPEAAYAEWCRVLKQGGRLLVFDANWNLRLFDTEMQRLYEEDARISKEMGLKNPHDDADMEEGDKISMSLPLSSKLRPQWDIEVLKECGFKEVFFEVDITGRVWDETEKVLYRSTPMFLVGGEK